MQDKYAADIGDYAKYGLLRTLTQGLSGCDDGTPVGLGDGKRQLRLGVIWYYVATNGPLPPMGQAFNFILNPNQHEQRLIECAPQLFEILSNLIATAQRAVEAIEGASVLPDDTVYFREPVNGPGTRIEWFRRASDAVRNCNLVFLDPDNGLVDDGGNPNAVAPEHATYQEAAQLWAEGRSLVIYQSFRRQGAESEIQFHAANVRGVLGIDGPAGEIIALWFHRRFARVFFVIPNPANPEVAQLLRERIDAFLACCWGTGRNPHFTRVDC